MKSIKLIEENLKTDTPVLVWGDPGVGKTSAVKGLAEQKDMHLEIVIGSVMQPTDFSGLPYKSDNGGVKFEPPSWAERLVEAGGGILFLDEITCPPETVQSALLRVIQEKVVGGLKLPEETRIVAAANPPDQAPNGGELPAPQANRFCHIEWEFDHEFWREGMVSGFPQENELNEKVRRARSTIASFIQKRPTLAIDVPDNYEDQGKAWPSPRTWTMVADHLAPYVDDQKGALDLGDLPDRILDLISGCVGEGPKNEFISFITNLDLQSPKKVLESPEIFEVPDRDDKTYCMVNEISSVALNDPEEYVHPALDVLKQIEQAGKGDMIIPALKRFVKNNKWSDRSKLTDKFQDFVNRIS